MADGHKCGDFKAPSSVKELLDFFDKFKVPTTNGQNGYKCTDVKDQATKAIFDEIRKRLKGNGKRWIRDGRNGAEGGPNPFCKDQQNASSNSGSMIDTIRGLQKLRTAILSNGNTNPYKFPDDNPDTDPCVKKYADAIIQNAFPLFGCLFYLWFMCDDKDAKDIKNGTSNGWDWTQQQVSNGGSGGSDGQLNKFLTDQQPTAEQLKKRMLTRGYNGGDLKSGTTDGKNLIKAGTGATLFRLECDGTSAGQFQNALYFLLFLAPRWHPAMSGHAILFLDWFDSNAKDVFKDVQWLHVKGAGQEYFQKCSELEKAIKDLASNTTGGISPVHKKSVTENGTGDRKAYNLYSPDNTGKTILHNDESFKNGNDPVKKAHVFMQYVSWLWWCIPHLTASLKAMEQDSGQWTQDKFQNSSSFGPFAFGFTFPCRYHITCMT